MGGVAFTEDRGQERMGWALVQCDGPRRHPGEMASRCGILEEAQVWRQVSLQMNREPSDCGAAWTTERSECVEYHGRLEEGRDQSPRGCLGVS